MDFIDVSIFGISEINNNCERYPALIIKINRPIPSKKDKKITIKIPSSGKINFDGGNSELEIMEIYHWLQYIFKKYNDYIIFDSTKKLTLQNIETSSSDNEEYDSIYDDDIDKIKELGLL